MNQEHTKTWFTIDDNQIMFMPVYGTQAMLDFANNFNDGKYPELIGSRY